MPDATLRSKLIRLAHENPEMRGHLLPLLKEACGCDGEAPTVGKFEEGKPADPTEHMSPEEAKEWWKHHERNKDQFKGASESTLYDSIRPGDKVTILTPQNQQVSGRAVMLGPAGWVLNLGGKHGRPGIASPGNVVNVVHKKAAQKCACGGKCSCGCGEAPTVGKFEEGKPADPTEHMTEEQRAEWWKHHERNKDQFKAAAAATLLKRDVVGKDGHTVLIPKGTLATVEFDPGRPSIAIVKVRGVNRPVKVSTINLHEYFDGYEIPPSRPDMRAYDARGEMAPSVTGLDVNERGWDREGAPSWSLVLHGKY